MPCQLEPTDDALLIYTSGSTSQPKGVLVQHRNLLAGACAALQAHELTEVDRVLCVLPLYHKNALNSTLMAALLSGGSVVLPQRFSLASYWELAATWQCTWSALTPTLVAQLAEAGASHHSQANSMRFVRCSSAALAPETRRAFETAFKTPLLEAMGSTETGLMFCNPLKKRKAGSPGLPTECLVKIVDDANMELSHGQVGEILIRTPSVMKCYHKNPTATAEVLADDGWLRTGDLGRLDNDGYAYIVGRAREVINKGGEKIAPREIDEALTRHPDVLEAAAVATVDAFFGQEIEACVVLKPDRQTTAAELISWCRHELGALKTPAAIHFSTDLPRGPTGKILRTQLAQSLSRATPALSTAGIAERHALERVITAAWSKSLKLDAIAPKTSFFELGGHSFLAMEILAELRTTLGINLPSSLFFEHPTIESQVEFIHKKGTELPLPRYSGGEGRGEGESAFATHSPLTRPSPRSTGEREETSLTARTALSHVQERIWFLEQLHPEQPIFNEAVAAELHGPLNTAALEAALNAVVARHEILRTSFGAVEGEPFQHVHDQAWLKLERVRCGPVDESTLQRLITADVQRRFDLSKSPLLRATLFELGPDRHVLSSAWHHLIADGYSRGLLFREMSNAYRAICRGSAYAPPPLKLQYADYAAWDRARTDRHCALNYWKEQLQGAPESLDLPIDFPRPTATDYAGVRVQFRIDEVLTRDLRRLSAGAGVSQFTTLVAAFNVLLHRYTGAVDILVGMPRADRAQPELRSMIGCVIDTLVLRTNLAGNPIFLELLQRVASTLSAAHAQHAAPFEEIVNALGLERTLDREPLFQVMINGRPPRFEYLDLEGIRAVQLPAHPGTAKFDLTLSLSEGSDLVRGELEYRTSLFTPATIERMLRHFQALLHGIAAQPQCRLAELPIESDSTFRAGPGVDYPQTCIHRLFEMQAERTPRAIAVQFGRQLLTYHDLNSRANQLAHYLRSLGVGPDCLVAVCMERSLDMAVALLGTLKAGAAYVPFDPSYPTERLSLMCEDAQPAAILSTENMASKLVALKRRIVCLDCDWPVIARNSTRNPALNATPGNLAYVLFTSGSTGKPKGVAMPHQPVVNLINWQIRQSARPRKTLQFAALSFDVSFQEIFSTWCAGGCLMLIDEDVRLDFVALLRLIQKEKLERLFLPVAALMHLAATAVAEQIYPSSLLEIITAGEALRITPEMVAFFEHLPHCRLENQYGPTETHVVSAYTLPGKPREWPALPSIGKPIANVNLYILDAQRNPVPAGVPGELYIGGAAPARGYLRHPEMTAERFLADPFSTASGARMYRSGDRARWLPDGNVQFLGRFDEQLKIRGFRVEPGEIEAALCEHPAVKEAVVMGRDDGSGSKSLIAFLVTHDGRRIALAECRDLVRRKLPDYMTPSAFVFLPTMPLTTSGKIDRQTLARLSLDSTASKSEVELSEPRSPTEETVAGIWSHILHCGPVGMRDSFFDLGGHSLLATQMVTRVNQAFRTQVSVRALFEKPVLSDFCTEIEKLRRANARLEIPPLEPAPRNRDIPLSFSQERTWLYRASKHNVSRAYTIRGPLDIAALQKTLDEIVRRHEALRTVFGERAGQPCQIVKPAAPAPISISDMRGRSEMEAIELCRENSRRGFDLSCDLPLRVYLLRLGAEEHILHMVLHHIAYDAFSMAIFYREAADFYAAFSTGQSVARTESPLQIADYAFWQRRLLDKKGKFYQQQLAFWTKQMAGPLKPLKLPCERAVPAANVESIMQRVDVSPEATQRLTEITRRCHGTMFMTLLAVFKALLARACAQDDILVGVYSDGRNHPRLDEIMGFFVNLLPLRTSVKGRPTFIELVERVRETTLNAYMHQDMPFELLVDELRGKKRPFPVISTQFRFGRQLNLSLHLPGLEVAPLRIMAGGPQWGFALYMEKLTDSLAGAMTFDARQHDPAVVARMGKEFEALVERVAADPMARL